MAKAKANLFSLFLLLSMITNTYSTLFTLTNNCSDTVWPGILSNPDKPPLSSTTGFALPPSSTQTLYVPQSWSGRLWARTFCIDDPDQGFCCATGDCGTGDVECYNNRSSSPATHAEFYINSNIGGSDAYIVRLDHGYNVPILVVPVPWGAAAGSGGGGCDMTGCVIDLNEICPAELKVYFWGYKEPVVACRSASAKGSHAQLFRKACPKAYNNAKSTFTCAGVAEYLITFCPRTDSIETTQRMNTVDWFSGSEAMDDAYVFALILFILSLVILVSVVARAGLVY